MAHDLLRQLQTGQVVETHTHEPELWARYVTICCCRPRTSTFTKNSSPSAIEGDAAMLIQRDRELQAALQASHKVNNLLIKRKNEELKQINTLAQELIAREYECVSQI